MITKDDILNAAREAGLSGPEILEFRPHGGYLAYWLYVGPAGHRSFTEIDPSKGKAELEAGIAALKGGVPAKGNELIGAVD